MSDISNRAEAADARRLHGRWSSGEETDEFVVDNPATGQPLAVVEGAGTKQVDEAVGAARAAQPGWRALTPRARGDYLRKIAGALNSAVDELAAIETSENGKPLAQARFDAISAAALFEMYGSLSESLPGSVRDVGSLMDVTSIEPYGVVAAVVPFNWPRIVTAGQIAPALAVGNTVVAKPPEQAPLSVLRMFEIMEPLLPADVIRLVPGGGSVGAALTAHPGIGKIAFTGAPGTGVKVMHAAAENLTPMLMELGGKNPFVVFEDADIDSAVRWALEGGFYNQGEACTAASRVIVHEAVYDEFAERLASAVAFSGSETASTRTPTSARSSTGHSSRRSLRTSASASRRAPGSPPRPRCQPTRSWPEVTSCPPRSSPGFCPA